MKYFIFDYFFDFESLNMFDIGYKECEVFLNTEVEEVQSTLTVSPLVR